MRKYNNRTKKTMIIILILFVVIIVIFSYAIKKSIDIDKTAYEITTGSIMFDEEYNMITTGADGVIKIRWGGSYYLKYNEEYYNLGSHAVVYNSNNGDINLYGKFYEVTKDGEVEVIDGENLIKSSVNSKFYKLADRKYLIIDRTIESSDSTFVTSNYLIVNLDKLGNATLLNDKTSYKTIKPTVLKTSSYTFDIANEKINFGADDVDLKKIIGSTNEYDEDTYNLNATENEDETKENGNGTGTGTGTGSGTNDGTSTETDENGTGTGTGTGTGAGTGESGVGTGNGTTPGNNTTQGTSKPGNNTTTNTDGTTAGNNSGFNNDYSSGVSDTTVQEIINGTKNTSVIRVTSDINSISVDYVVYDPLNEYKSVYIEIEDTDNGNIKTVYLSKTDTNIKINELSPKVYYNLTFKYSYYDEKEVLKEYTFDEVGLKTKVPKMVLNVTKITKNRIYYQILLDNNYNVTGGTIQLAVNNQFTDIKASITSQGVVNTISGDDCYIDISNLELSSDTENVIDVRITSLSFNTHTINPGVNYKFRY